MASPPDGQASPSSPKSTTQPLPQSLPSATPQPLSAQPTPVANKPTTNADKKPRQRKRTLAAEPKPRHPSSQGQLRSFIFSKFTLSASAHLLYPFACFLSLFVQCSRPGTPSANSNFCSPTVSWSCHFHESPIPRKRSPVFATGSVPTAATTRPAQRSKPPSDGPSTVQLCYTSRVVRASTRVRLHPNSTPTDGGRICAPTTRAASSAAAKSAGNVVGFQT